LKLEFRLIGDGRTSISPSGCLDGRRFGSEAGARLEPNYVAVGRNLCAEVVWFGGAVIDWLAMNHNRGMGAAFRDLPMWFIIL
jgi:hypothetical protein